ncbi:MAG: hypothetical protein ACRELB_23980, partial [Polyangiaceae bacterium]
LLDPSPCLTGGDVFYGAEVDDNGSESATLRPPSASFSANVTLVGQGIVDMQLRAELPDMTTYFWLYMSSPSSDAGIALPFEVGTYTGASGLPGPGLSLYFTYNDAACGGPATFTISTLSGKVDLASDLTVAFATICDQPVHAYTYGCVHFDKLATP